MSNAENKKILSFADWEKLSDEERKSVTWKDLTNLPFKEMIKFPADERSRMAEEDRARHKAELDESFKNLKEKLAEPQKEDSLIVSGKAYDCPCNADRMWMCMNIYDKPDYQIQEQFRTPMREAMSGWRLVEKREKPSIMFRARYYEARNGFCEPTLVFRGSVGDLSGIGLYIYLKIGDNVMLDQVFTFSEKTRDQDKNMLHDDGYALTTLLDETGLVELHLGSNAVYIPVPSPDGGVAYQKMVDPKTYDYHLKIIIGANNTSCHSNNVRQTLGHPSAQYAEAAQFGMDWAQAVDRRNKLRAKGKPMQAFYCTGHSLGGGLASCAAHWAQHICHDLPVYGVTYNASGLHANSVPKKQLGSVPVFNHYIKDEILSTAELFPRKIPFLGRLLSMFGVNLPQPYGDSMPHQALYPHPVVDSMPKDEKDTVHPDLYPDLKEMDAMPKIWPVEEETLFPLANFSELKGIENELFFAHGASGIVRILGNAFYDGHPSLEDIVNGKKVNDVDRKALKEKLYKEMGKGSAMDNVIKTQTLEALAREDTIKHLEYGASTYGVAMVKFAASEVRSGHPETLYRGGRLWWHWSDLMKLFQASADYHGMDVVAESIFMPEYYAEKKKKGDK